MTEELESEKELDVADPTEVEEETTDTTTENDDENDVTFDDSESNQESENSEEEEKSSSEKQSSEDNSKYAAARRKAEEEFESKVKSREDEAYKRGRLDAYKGKINPYTNTEIKDITDVEVYEDMYKISEEGKDPLKDYASYAADKRREETRLKQERQERESKAQQEIEEFSKKYPDVNISSLFKDEVFMDYADGKNKSLIDVYESFNKMKNSFRNQGIKTAKKAIANNISSPGSLGNSSDNFIDYENMSREEFLKEVEKVKEG